MAKKRFKAQPNFSVRVVQVNCDAASGRSKEHVIHVLQKAAAEADVLLAVECFTIDAVSALPEFFVVQTGERNSSEATNVAAVRKDRGHITKIKSKKATRALPKLNVRERYWLKTKIQIDDLRPVPFSVGHPQPKRAWALWGTFMAQAPRGVLGIDANKLKRALVVRFPLRQVRQIHLLAVIVPSWIPTSKAKSIPIKVADHDRAVQVTLWPELGQPDN